ncbi:CLUMA_CG006594, isoform A [Clunio marinus]|uniref:CLUMA_CG006594, isoform A n=1 Tax=Clunio marinus TaxID=568069 RepID=A0A1J1I0N8_9DIPT|nr:CLUMA_CG006594, isoform A [Clunio marinus]
MERIRQTRKVAPDGGFGWVVTFGVSLVNLATRSIEPSFGLLFGDLLKDLDVGTTGAAVIISTLDIMMNLSGLFVGPLLKEFSYRKVAIVGSLLCAVGLALTSTAGSMAHILTTYSVINGIGVGLAMSAAFVALNHFFAKKRGQAVGLSMAGTAIGMLIMPQLVRFLLEEFSFRGSVLVLAGLALHSAVGSILLQPVKWHLKDEEVDVEMFEAENPTLGIIQEDDGDEDSLPEIQSLLFKDHKHRERKISETSNGSLLAVPNGIPKRPTFPRITSSHSMGPKRTPTLPKITSTADMNQMLRKRKESVISSLSLLDFSGSCLQIHLETGDKDQEEMESHIRRVNTHVGTSIFRDNLNSSFKMSKSDINQKFSCPDFIQTDIGLEMPEPKKESFWRRFANLMDIGLLKDGTYLNILFGLSIFYVAEMNFKMVTPFFLASLGYTKGETAYCLSISALTDILARVIVPPICDKTNVSKRKVFMVSLLFVALTRSIVAEQSDLKAMLAWLCIAGFFRGIALSNFTLTVSEYSSLEKLPAAFGWHMVGKAIFVIIFGPLIGAIRDLTGSFPICIHSQSVCILICIFAWMIEFIIKYLKRNEKQHVPIAIISTE